MGELFAMGAYHWKQCAAVVAGCCSFLSWYFRFIQLLQRSLPGPISGMASSPGETASYHVMSIESILGLPFRAFAQLVIGFLDLWYCATANWRRSFFHQLWLFAAFGHVRGGSAKVAIMYQAV